MTNEELRMENDRLKVRVGELEDRFVPQYDVALKLAEKRIAALEVIAGQLAVFAAAYRSHSLRDPDDILDEVLAAWEQMKGGAK